MHSREELHAPLLQIWSWTAQDKEISLVPATMASNKKEALAELQA
jgi:hypothetical protein